MFCQTFIKCQDIFSLSVYDFCYPFQQSKATDYLCVSLVSLLLALLQITSSLHALIKLK